jgi:GR25 family glycosyltransferase involved in LPS biosynthesis
MSSEHENFIPLPREEQNNIKVYYINLDRRPDRNEFMTKQLENQSGITPIRFKAIEGVKHTFTVEETKLFSKSNFKGTKHYFGIAGNFLSHLELWKKMIEEGDEYIIILQDDIALVKDFGIKLHKILSDLPSNSEIVNIAQLFVQPQRKHYFVCNLTNQTKMRNKVTFIKKEVTSEVGILHPFINPQSSGYILTKQGAKNIIEHTYSQGVLKETDKHLNDYLNSKNIFYQSYYILGTVASKFGSDIFF